MQKAEIITQPYAGEYRERIYDITSPWNSQEWTWVKFEDEEETWCGVFRGAHKGVAFSQKYSKVLILTTDYLYALDCDKAEIIEYEAQPQYNDITVTPDDDFLVASYYDIEIIKESLQDRETLERPFEMDMIKFHEWDGSRLKVSCYKFLDWNERVEFFLDMDVLEVIGDHVIVEREA